MTYRTPPRHGLKPTAGNAISPVSARCARRTGLHLLASRAAGPHRGSGRAPQAPFLRSRQPAKAGFVWLLQRIHSPLQAGHPESAGCKKPRTPLSPRPFASGSEAPSPLPRPAHPLTRSPAHPLTRSPVHRQGPSRLPPRAKARGWKGHKPRLGSLRSPNGASPARGRSGRPAQRVRARTARSVSPEPPAREGGLRVVVAANSFAIAGRAPRIRRIAKGLELR
jgi:hypothetical protein